MKKILCLILTFILSISFTTTGSFAFSPSKFEDAPVLDGSDKFLKGEISATNEAVYKFILTETSKVRICVSTETKGIQGYIYEENANAPIYECEITTKKMDSDFITLLDAGTYYCKLKGEPSTYKIKSAFTSYGNLEKINNNTFASAEKLKKSTVKTGAITLNDRIDVYKFTLKKRKKVVLWQVGTGGDAEFGLKYNIYKLNTSKRRYDFKKKKQIAYNIEKERLIYNKIGHFFDDDTWYYADSYLLDKGTYYIAIEPEHLYDNSLYKIKLETKKPEPAMYIPYGKFNIQKLKIKVNTGKTMYIKAGKVKKWSVSKSNIITVSKSGYVKGIKKGKAEVVATLTNNKKLRCKVIVK